MKDLKNIREKVKILEGKKQAFDILKSKYDKDDIDNILYQLSFYDPTTPQNKYLEVLATVFLKERTTLDNFIADYRKLKMNSLFDSFANRKLQIKLSDIKGLYSLKDILIEALQDSASKLSLPTLNGLKEGKDYLTVYEDEEIIAIAPTHRDASITMVGNPTNNHWCTAFVNKNLWNQYVYEQGSRLIYVFSKLGLKWRKQAIEIQHNNNAIYWFYGGADFDETDAFDGEVVLKNYKKVKDKLNDLIEKEEANVGYAVIRRIGGVEMEVFSTRREAEELISEWDEEDRNDEDYQEDAYYIKEK